VITAIRNLRAERNVPPSAKVAPIVVAPEPVVAMLVQGEQFLKSLTNASSITITTAADRPADSAVAVLADAEVILPLEGLIDKAAEATRLRKSLADLDKQLGPVRAKLGNEQFLSRAPADVVAGLRSRETELVGQRASVAEVLASLGDPPR
jgi:valyl-tRNA synthetase